jgi:hypothetical protein
MMAHSLNRLMAWWLALAVLLQAALIVNGSPATRAQSIQFVCGAVCLALLVASLWNARRYLNSHTDMLLIMFASGGLGMCLSMSGHMHHANPAASWPMWAGMLALGFAPAIFFSRCLKTARQRGYLGRAVLIDFAAMFAAMWLSSSANIQYGSWTEAGQHFNMLGGMLVGMLAGMWIRSVLLFPAQRQAGKALTRDTSEARVRTSRSC